MADDEDEASFGGAYEEGHWAWDDFTEDLVFVSDVPPKPVDTIAVAVKLTTGAVEFKDIDLLEQMRFRKRYQRKLKPGQADVISLQDVKDLAIYTAPLPLLTKMLIDVLHLPTTDRFIRALILYCQYYLEVSEEMSRRMQELQTKVRTVKSEPLEATYRENLCDLRTMVAKEYSTIIIGGDDTKEFHHMGAQKKRQSLSDRDARLFETLLRMSIQVVWLALGRRSFDQIEMEVNRMFKSEIFNFVEHTLKTGYLAKLTPEERSVLLGNCVRYDKKLNTRSPLINEVFCHRPIDYRMMGLGVITYNELTPRLRYLLLAVSGPEEELQEMGITCGILGFPRSFFDTTLHVLQTVVENATKSKSSIGSSSKSKTTESLASSKSVGSNKKVGDKSEKKYLYNEIRLPLKEPGEPPFPPTFPDTPAPVQPCNTLQRSRWQTRLYKLLHPPKIRRKSAVYKKSETETT